MSTAQTDKYYAIEIMAKIVKLRVQAHQLQQKIIDGRRSEKKALLAVCKEIESLREQYAECKAKRNA